MPRRKLILGAKNERCRRLGAQFRNLREARGHTLASLSGAMGRALNTIRSHEVGAVMLRTDDLFTAAEVLKVRPSELLYIKEESHAE